MSDSAIVESWRQYVDWVVLTKMLMGQVDDPATRAAGALGYLPYGLVSSVEITVLDSLKNNQRNQDAPGR